MVAPCARRHSETEWEFEAPARRYVKDFADAASCADALTAAKKTKAEALAIINTQIGRAIVMLRKAAAALKRNKQGKRSTEATKMFQRIFRVPPDFVPTWFKPTATIRDRGDVVRVRCLRVADMLESGGLRYFCQVNGTNCPACATAGTRPTCSSWGAERVVCLGEFFFEAMGRGDTDWLRATLMHEPFHIYYGVYVTEHDPVTDAGPRGKFSGIYCIQQFVYEVNGAKPPEAFTDRCNRTNVRRESEAVFEWMPAWFQRDAEGPTPAPSEYIAWVQRSLNRIFGGDGPPGTGLLTDGAVTPAYRDAVRRFQRSAGLPDTGDVDEATQNAIIKANERSRKYLLWVHRALELNSIFSDPPLPAKNPKTGSFKSYGLDLGIKAFQERRGLKKDGFVGSKTELALMKSCSCTPPGQVTSTPKPKPLEPAEDNWIEVVDSIMPSAVAASLQELQRLQCLKLFLLSALRGEAVDDRYRLAKDVGVYRFVEDFKRRCAGKKGLAAARCLKSMHKDLLFLINYAMGGIIVQKVGHQPDGCVCRMQECDAGRFLLKKARQTNPVSVYRCFRNVIEPGFVICREPCASC